MAQRIVLTEFRATALLVLAFASGCALPRAYAAPRQCSTAAKSAAGAQEILVSLVSDHILHVRMGGTESNPSFVEATYGTLPRRQTGDRAIEVGCQSRFLKPSLIVSSAAIGDLSIETVDRSMSLTISTQKASQGILSLARKDHLDLFGMSGLNRDAPSVLTRNDGAIVRAGSQGDAGARLFFTINYGMLIASDGGRFSVQGSSITYTDESSKPLRDVYIFLGPPIETMQSIAEVSGHSPMPPQWTLGFLHSLWGTDEMQIREFAETYTEKKIPLNAFILDFDWKAWGEDDYGEWRWNSTKTKESFSPDLFPDGASGGLATDLLHEGIFVAGILKPRILLYHKGTTQLHEAAQYAEDHHLWYPGEPIANDYFTGRPTRDLDFSLPETRRWYWEHLKPTFDAGIAGWWNDEADHAPLPDKSIFDFNNLQFAHMGQTLYEGQRLSSNTRVWSVNRNFFLGAQRYGYAEWSGDIDTGWKSMQAQPARMISTLNLGETHWSMDTGGFKANPSPENYARWIEFGAFVPVMRVHGDLHLNRAPWAFGIEAERATTKAIRLRSALLPYLSSAEKRNAETGIGIVRPLLWMYPDDAEAKLQTSEWMVGDAILASPVLAQGEQQHSTYLPAGEWVDYWTGDSFGGQQTIQRKTDSTGWTDIPLYIRRGSFVALSDPKGSGTSSPCPIALDTFPSQSANTPFDLYEDDGLTYNYEQGHFFRQRVSIRDSHDAIRLSFAAATGDAEPTAKCIIVRLHTDAAVHGGANAAARQLHAR